jgi:hypothetical protein
VWNHIGLTGDYSWDANKRVAKGGFRLLRRLRPAESTVATPATTAGFRCDGGRAKRSNSAHPAIRILGECVLPSYFQRTVTTRPAESERELALVNPVCQLDSGNRDSSVGERLESRGPEHQTPASFAWPQAVVRYLDECAGEKSLSDDRDHLRKLEPYLRSERLDAVDMRALQPFIRDRKEKDGVRNATINRALSPQPCGSDRK